MLKGEKIKLQKIDVWLHNSTYMNSLQVTLSNGTKSELFKAATGQNENQTTLNLTSDTMRLDINSSPSVVSGLKFFDRNNSEISTWGGPNSWKN